MPDYSKYPNSATLGRNQKIREGKNDPPYRGQGCLDGVEFWINAWVKTNPQDGSSFFSMSLQRKDDVPARGPTTQQQQRPQQQNTQRRPAPPPQQQRRPAPQPQQQEANYDDAPPADDVPF